MITSSSISYVSQMLEEPQNITDADAESIRLLTETYPYFVPARYMQAAYQHKIAPYSTEMMDTMQLFSANLLMYGDFLQTAVGGEEIPYEPTVVAEPRMKVVLPEPIDDELTEEEALAETPVPENVTIIPQEEQQTAIIQELAAANKLAVEEEQTPEPESNDEEDFVPENTGFIRSRKAETQVENPVNNEDAPALQAEEPQETAEATEAVKEEKTASQFKKAIRTDWDTESENLIPPIYTEDYFRHQGMHVSNDIPREMAKPSGQGALSSEEKSLMVVMSFTEWLMFYKKKKQQEREEERDQKELKTMWQKEKLAAALEEENEEIPENVFEMAVNSITKEENLVSESLAEVMVKQGRYDRAIEMYKKLSLHKPQKKAYFARRIEEILKEK